MKVIGHDDLHIDLLEEVPELLEANPQRTVYELQTLEEQIRAEGEVRDRLVVWDFNGRKILADGFSRKGIVKRLHENENFSPVVPVVYGDFTSMEEVRYWIGINQTGRRNLTDQEKMYYHGKLMEELKDRKNLQNYMLAMGREMVKEPNVAEIVMDIHNVSRAYVFNANQFFQGIEKLRKSNVELTQAILTDQLLDAKGEKITVNRELVRKYSAVKSNKSVADINELIAIVKNKKNNDQKAKTKDETPDVSINKKEIESIQSKVKSFLDTPTRELLDEINGSLETYLKASARAKAA